MNADQLIAVIGQASAILAALGTGFFVAKRAARTDSVQSATAEVEIAQAKVEAAIPTGQFEELRRLQLEFKKVSEDFLALSHRVTDLEVTIDAVEAYIEVIILCPSCAEINKRMLQRIRELLKRRNATKAAECGVQAPTVEEVAATFAGKENYQRGVPQ